MPLLRRADSQEGARLQALRARRGAAARERVVAHPTASTRNSATRSVRSWDAEAHLRTPPVTAWQPACHPGSVDGHPPRKSHDLLFSRHSAPARSRGVCRDPGERAGTAGRSPSASSQPRARQSMGRAGGRGSGYAAVRAENDWTVWTGDDHVANPFAGRDARTFISEVLPMAPDVTVQIAHLGGSGPRLDPGTEEAMVVLAQAASAGEAAMKNVWFDIATNIHPGSPARDSEFMAARMRQIGMSGCSTDQTWRPVTTSCLQSTGAHFAKSQDSAPASCRPSPATSRHTCGRRNAIVSEHLTDAVAQPVILSRADGEGSRNATTDASKRFATIQNCRIWRFFAVCAAQNDGQRDCSAG
jgi:hypothetical protein